MKASVDEIRARFDNDVERFSNLEAGQTATEDAALGLELVSAAAGVFPLERITLVDLSANMLDRAVERLGSTGAELRAMQCDVRDLEPEAGSQDVIVAAAVLHHLRAEVECAPVFRPLYGAYLAVLKDAEYRDKVFAYIDYEDSPRRPHHLRGAGFKNGCFAAIGAYKT